MFSVLIDQVTINFSRKIQTFITKSGVIKANFEEWL